MDTRFIKISAKNSDIPKWSNFFRAGDAWLESLEVLRNSKEQLSWAMFYVIPPIVAFCLELFVKAVAAHEDNTLDGMSYRHRTHEILNKYAGIPLFNKTINNSKLYNLIKEYEKTVDSRFGETTVSINGEDQQKIIDSIYEFRNEMCKRTGLH